MHDHHLFLSVNIYDSSYSRKTQVPPRQRNTRINSEPTTHNRNNNNTQQLNFFCAIDAVQSKTPLAWHLFPITAAAAAAHSSAENAIFPTPNACLTTWSIVDRNQKCFPPWDVGNSKSVLYYGFSQVLRLITFPCT